MHLPPFEETAADEVRAQLERLRGRIRRQRGRLRCGALLVGGCVFCAVQVAVFVSLLRSNDERTQLLALAASRRLHAVVEHLRRIAAAFEPAAQPAPAEPEEESPPSLLVEETLALKQSMTNRPMQRPMAPLPSHADGAAAAPLHPVVSAALASPMRGRPSRLTRPSDPRLRWDFGVSSYSDDEVTLHGCSGNGTFGAVIDASARGRRLVVKLPILRHWGFKFHRAERRALEAIGSLGGPRRHVVNLLGNASFSVRSLLALLDGEPSALFVSTEREGDPHRWDCLNRTDLRLADSLGVDRLPLLLLEAYDGPSVFKWLASVAAPAESRTAPLEAQRRLFDIQLGTSLATDHGDAFRSALTLLIGVSRGMGAIQRAHVLQRDLSEPGKNALIHQDRLGLTASLIDFSQADVCSTDQGEAGRALEMYSFGNVLYFACYGEVARGLEWTKYSCAGVDLPSLIELGASHRRRHPDGRAAPPTRYNRCQPKLRLRLDGLMQYCWAPALAAAQAAERAAANGASRATSSRLASEAVAARNHSWVSIVEQLEAARETHVHLFRLVGTAHQVDRDSL
jgi:hypothetical protein